MWACRNDREEDLRRSPRESRITVAPRFGPVKEGRCVRCAVRSRLANDIFAHLFARGTPRACPRDVVAWWR